MNALGRFTRGGLESALQWQKLPNEANWEIRVRQKHLGLRCLQKYYQTKPPRNSNVKATDETRIRTDGRITKRTHRPRLHPSQIEISDLRWARGRKPRMHTDGTQTWILRNEPNSKPGQELETGVDFYQTKPLNALAPATPGRLKSALQSKNYQTKPPLGAQFNVSNPCFICVPSVAT